VQQNLMFVQKCCWRFRSSEMWYYAAGSVFPNI